MARQIGPIPLSGTIGGINFFNIDGKNYARLAKQQSKRRFKEDASYERSRENSSEFGRASKAAALFRRVFKSHSKQFTDMHYAKRTVNIMMAIRKLDNKSVRGERSISAGLLRAEGRALLDGFNFHPSTFLQAIVLKAYMADVAHGVVSFTDLVTERDFVVPRFATHVELLVVHAVIDFEHKAYEKSAEVVCLLPVDGVSRDVVLRPAEELMGEGVRFLVLRVQFFRFDDEEVLPLKGCDVAMQVVGIEPGVAIPLPQDAG